MLSRFFINRPIFSAVISIVIIISGVIALLNLPISRYPQVTPPTVVVSAFYPGANAKVVAETVATPIEQEVNGVEGMIYMSSTCTNSGAYSLTVTFKVGTDMDMATVLVQNRVAQAEPKLPSEVSRQGVTVKKRSSDILQLISLTSTDKELDTLFLRNFANLRLKDQLIRVPGVGNVLILGSSEYSMRVWLDPDRLKSYSLSAIDVVNAVREQNVQVAAGVVGQSPAPKDQVFQFTVTTQGRLRDAEEFNDIVVKTAADNRQIRIGDIARVELGAQSYGTAGRINCKDTVLIAIQQLPEANALDVADAIEMKMKELYKSFPEGVEYKIPLDTTTYVRDSIKEVVTTLFITCIIVFITILLFLQDWRATIIPAATIPVSLIGTFAVMLGFGFSINLLTLFGLILAIGIVVDDAIVVVENTARMMEDGLSSREAAIKSMEEVTGPVIATTLVLVAVFVPASMMSGITGQMFRQFAVTITVATLFSTLNALTLSPALCALLMRPLHPGSKVQYRWFEWIYEKFFKGYHWITKKMVRRATLSIFFLIIIMGLSFFGLKNLPTSFLPEEDPGYALMAVQLPDAASLDRTKEVMARVEEKLANVDGLEYWVAVSGYSFLDGGETSSGATVWLSFEPFEIRLKKGASMQKILKQVNNIITAEQEAWGFAMVPPSIPGLGLSGGFEMMLQDRGDAGNTALQQMIGEISTNSAKMPEIEKSYSTFRANIPQVEAVVDRQKVKRLNLSLSDVFSTLQFSLGSIYANDFTIFGRNYQVNIQNDAKYRSNLEHITSLDVRNRNGKMIPLSTFTDTNMTFGPQFITRYNMYPSAQIRGNAALTSSSGEALKAMEELADNILPNSMGFEWTGMAFQEKQVTAGAVLTFLLSAIFVYLVLCAQYESWTASLCVLLAVPLALLGTVAGVYCSGTDVNIYTQIGIVLLIGLAAKTAILIVEFARELRLKQNKPIKEAAETAALLRFRPVLMTALTFVFGTIPLLVATGAGSESRRALGTAVFYGMLSGTIFSVLLIPSFFVVIQRFSEWSAKIRNRKSK